MDSKSYISELQLELQGTYYMGLKGAAEDYLNIGLEHFHQTRKEINNQKYQAALGNLAISVELLLKAFIATRNISLLFKGLSPEARILLSCADSLPENFKWRAAVVELKSMGDKFIDFGESAAIFFAFFPDIKQSLKSHLDSLMASRNASVHSVMPSFHKYELERAAYVSLKICRTIDPAWQAANGDVESANHQFLEKFQESRLEYVQNQIKQAKEIAKRLSGKGNPIRLDPSDQDYWKKEIGVCPICSNDALILGYTDFPTEDVDLGNGLGIIPLEHVHPVFYVEGFHCKSCGLLLRDYDEVILAGMDTIFETWARYKDGQWYRE